MSIASSNPVAVAPTSDPPGLTARVAIAAGDIKLSHSIFAMPFALLAAFLARPAEMPWRLFAAALLLIVVCMFTARTWAMLINRLADRLLDARNPRTSGRAFASGRLSPAFGIALAALVGGLFIGAAMLFWPLLSNPWPARLAVPVLLWIGAYSFTKRFTWACHLFLGTSLAASPLAAAIALNPALLGLPPEHAPGVPEGTATALWCFAAMVTLWVAGFDIIYSLQDVEQDQRERLFSIPSRFGVYAAIWMSRCLHGFAFLFLAAAWWIEPRFGAPFGVAVALVGALLVIEHAILSKRGKSGLNAAFFTMNGLVSLAVGGLGIADCIL